MNGCLRNIVTLGICPDAGESLSGFTLMQADGISLKNLANIADDSTVKGTDLAMQKKELSINQVYNDFIAALQSQNIITNLTVKEHYSASFVTNQNNGIYSGFRGQTLHKVHTRDGLKKQKITSIECYPLTSGNTTLRIDDGRSVYNYPVTVIANQVNVFDESNLSGLPLIVDAQTIEITIDQSEILFAKSSIICHKGCGGQMPNDCGWVDGWNGIAATKNEGYGLNIKFSCECDYGRILCDLSKSFIGEIIWLKWQINIFREQLKSNRFNNWVIYNGEKIQNEILPDLTQQYNEKWNALMNGVYNILKSYNDDCLNCRGRRWVVNI